VPWSRTAATRCCARTRPCSASTSSGSSAAPPTGWRPAGCSACTTAATPRSPGARVPWLDDEGRLAEAFRDFEPLPSRLALVHEQDGVAFVDDSISTNVLSTSAAVESFPGRRTALLVGGLERDIDYRPLADAVRGRDVRVLTMPTNGPQIGAVLRDAGIDAVQDCASLDEAVSAGFAWARPGGVVLLSPAAASFDRFADYRARGAAFTAAARALGDAT